MPVNIRIPTYLASFSGGRSEILLQGSPGTVSEALAALWGLHPALKDRILDEIRRFVGDAAQNDDMTMVILKVV